MFGARNPSPGPLAWSVPEGDGLLVARHGHLWLVSSGPGLILLDATGDDPTEAHRRVVGAADRLRLELFEHLTVAPFIDPLVLVPDRSAVGPGLVPAGLVGDLVLTAPPHPMADRVGALIDEGRLRDPWRRHHGAAVAG